MGKPSLWEGSSSIAFINAAISQVFSMQKLLVFVRSENARATNDAEERSNEDGWQHVAKRVKVSCAHVTSLADGEEILAKLEKFAARTYAGEVPVVKKEYKEGDVYYTWQDDEKASSMSIQAPARLMDQARAFFNV